MGKCIHIPTRSKHSTDSWFNQSNIAIKGLGCITDTHTSTHTQSNYNFCMLAFLLYSVVQCRSGKIGGEAGAHNEHSDRQNLHSNHWCVAERGTPQSLTQGKLLGNESYDHTNVFSWRVHADTWWSIQIMHTVCNCHGHPLTKLHGLNSWGAQKSRQVLNKKTKKHPHLLHILAKKTWVKSAPVKSIRVIIRRDDFPPNNKCVNARKTVVWWILISAGGSDGRVRILSQQPDLHQQFRPDGAGVTAWGMFS